MIFGKFVVWEDQTYCQDPIQCSQDHWDIDYSEGKCHRVLREVNSTCVHVIDKDIRIKLETL